MDQRLELYELRKNLHRAEEELAIAWRQFHYAKGTKEVDLAIAIIHAAEQKCDNLLIQVKENFSDKKEFKKDLHT